MKVLFSITGVVTPSSQRGRSLGFPTANLPLPEAGIADGIYTARVFKADEVFPGILFVGSALTFDETARKAEVYILDKVSDWYGDTIKVEALKKIRDNIKFSSPAALVEQMKLDEQAAKNYFESLGQTE